MTENQPEPVESTEADREAALTVPVVRRFQQTVLHGLRGSNIDPGVVMVTLTMQGVFIGVLQQLLIEYSQTAKPITMADIHRANRASLEDAIAELQRPMLQLASSIGERSN